PPGVPALPLPHALPIYRRTGRWCAITLPHHPGHREHRRRGIEGHGVGGAVHDGECEQGGDVAAAGRWGGPAVEASPLEALNGGRSEEHTSERSHVTSSD